jgi:DNA replication and repair protein RecF
MLNNITIYNYRNISKLTLDLNSKGNILIAPNGSGKTNFLESIFYSIFRTSFKPMLNYSELIGPKANYIKVSTRWDKDDLSLLISNDGKLIKRFLLNGKSVSIDKIINLFPVVLFAPHSVDLTNGEPSIRRKDLDTFLALVDSQYLELIKKYTRILKNRNAVIKMIKLGKADTEQLKYWTDQIITLSKEIYIIRNNFFQDIKYFVKETYRFLYHDIKDFEILYRPNFLIENIDDALDIIKNKFETNQDKEIVVGKTLYGIHKDDYSFIFDGKELRYQGSRGQQRIGSLILKIAQIEMLRALRKSSDILFLIDDIMSELDNEHREKISNYLVNLDLQFILTGADLNEIPQVLIDVSNKLKLV